MRIETHIENIVHDFGGDNKADFKKRLYYFAGVVERAAKKQVIKSLGRDYKNEPDLIDQKKINQLEKEKYNLVNEMHNAHLIIADTFNQNKNLELKSRVYNMITRLPKNIEFDLNILPEPIKTEFIVQSLGNENIQFNDDFNIFWLQK